MSRLLAEGKTENKMHILEEALASNRLIDQVELNFISETLTNFRQFFGNLV